jgi:predicted acetyltransferase
MVIDVQNFESTPLRDGELILEFVRFEDHPIHKVPTCYFRMVHGETGAELGAINLRCSSIPHIERYAGHIGFAVHEPHRGHRYAARSVALLIAVAKQLKFEGLWITCDPDNTASRRSLELAGATFIEEVNVPPDCIINKAGHRRKVPLSN